MKSYIFFTGRNEKNASLPGWNRLTDKIHFMVTVILMLTSVSVHGQNSDIFKPISIDSVLRTPVILPDYNAYRIGNYQFIVHYTGVLKMQSPYAELRFAQISKVHPEVKLLLINSGAVVKTKEGRELEISLKDKAVFDKLKAFDHPVGLKLKVKMIEGNYKSTRAGLDYQNVIYRDFIIQDVEAVNK